jgi:outer membrane protein OmpA-like peptidoglycan-associated protein
MLLSHKVDLYIGTYINYGLNNALKANTKEVYLFDGTYNTMLASIQTNKVKLLSFGLKVSLCLRFGKMKQRITVSEYDLVNKAPRSIQKVDSGIVKIIKQGDSIAAALRNELARPVLAEQTATPTDSGLTKDPVVKAQEIAASLNLTFGFGLDQSTNVENDKIKALSDILNVNQNITLCIVGHCCNIGSHEVNIREGLKRAIAIKQLIIKHNSNLSASC